MQTGFMKNRNISENILSLLNVIDRCEKQKIEAVILSVDFHKAFDTIEWDAIYKVMEFLNFGPFFIEASRIL